MNSSQSKNLVLITGITIAAITMFESSVSASKKLTKGTASTTGTVKGTYSVYKKLFALGIAMIILSFLADQVPEVVGPFTLLLLVVYVYKNESIVVNEFGANK